jgi:hypothetical protein
MHSATQAILDFLYEFLSDQQNYFPRQPPEVQEMGEPAKHFATEELHALRFDRLGDVRHGEPVLDHQRRLRGP